MLHSSDCSISFFSVQVMQICEPKPTTLLLGYDEWNNYEWTATYSFNNHHLKMEAIRINPWTIGQEMLLLLIVSIQQQIWLKPSAEFGTEAQIKYLTVQL